MEKYYVVLSALTEATVDRVRHVVEAEPDENSYTNLKDGLLASHVMTDYQKIDKLLQLEPLNGRKPSNMLVDMERLKPADNEQYFAFMFLQRLPREVRVLLSGDPIANMRLLAEKADALMAPVAAATPDGEEECVTAVKAGGKSGSKNRFKKKQKNQRSLSPSDEKKSPLCWLHIRFGDKARRCEQHFPPHVKQCTLRAAAEGRQRPEDTLLGQPPPRPAHSGQVVPVGVSISRRQLPHTGDRFSQTFWAPGRCGRQEINSQKLYFRRRRRTSVCSTPTAPCAAKAARRRRQP
jgi:hypothetical protein